MDFSGYEQNIKTTEPLFLQKSEKVMGKLSKLKPRQLSKLQSISDNLANLNWTRNQEWTAHPVKENQTCPAVLTFNGDVYQGLQARTWDEETLNYAQNHLLILSGLYGVLRPLDQIMPYRLEMGTDLSVGRSKNLYEFWKKDLAEFAKTLDKEHPVINLASNEYYKAWQTAGIKNPMVEVKFLDEKNGKYKPIQYYVKKARGTMAAWIMRNRVDNTKTLLTFDADGYGYNDGLSTENELVFTRDEK